MESGDWTVMVVLWVMKMPFASDSFTVNVTGPAVVGVPVTAPPLEMLSPAGREPEEMVKVYGVLPPLPVTVAEYDELT